MAGPHQRPFRFSVQCSSLPSADPRSWAELARRCEDLGYATLTISDHLDDQLAPLPALVAAAGATTTLRVGTMVLSNDLRHPVVLAKEAATVDLLSGGRFELGLGAGWMPGDYRRAGIPFDRPGLRIERLAEAIAVVKGLMAPGPLTFSGRHYQVDGLQGTPKPVQRPHPPLLVGGGSPRILALAAREADVVGLLPSMAAGAVEAADAADATAEGTEEKLAWVRQAAGERWADLELQVRVHVVAVTPHRDDLVAAAAPTFGLTPEQALASPYALCGTVDQIVDDLVARRERFGFSAIGVDVDALDELAPVVARLAGT